MGEERGGRREGKEEKGEGGGVGWGGRLEREGGEQKSREGEKEKGKNEKSHLREGRVRTIYTARVRLSL